MPLALCWLAAAVAAPPASALTAEEIVRKAVERQGGFERLGKVKDLYVHLDYKTKGKEQIEGDLHQFYQSPDRLATVLRSHLKPDMIKVYDGKAGRFMRRGQPRIWDMDKTDLEKMKETLSRAQLLLLSNLFVEGARFELLKQILIPGSVLYRVRWKGPDGRTIELQINGDFLLVSAAFSGELQVRFGEFKVYDGVRIPSQLTVREKGEDTALLRISKVDFKRACKAEVFQDPRKALELVPD